MSYIWTTLPSAALKFKKTNANPRLPNVEGNRTTFFPISWRTYQYTPILPPNKRVKRVFRWTPFGTRVTKYQPFGE